MVFKKDIKTFLKLYFLITSVNSWNFNYNVFISFILLACNSHANEINEKTNTLIFILVCKFFVTELQSRLDETGKTKETLQVGHGLDKKKKIVYHKS